MPLFIYFKSDLQSMDLTFLNELKKDNKVKRKLQNKRYREKYKEVINLKKQLVYRKQIYKSKLENVLKA